MIEYKVLSVQKWYAAAIDELTEYVRQHIKAGWVPCGSMQMCHSGETGSGNVIVSQTLTREKK